MSSDNRKSDEYWMGVRDALRMVDSFNKWANRNPGRAKTLDDFIHDGLIAAAKRCESCLKEKLGLSFSSEEEKIEYDEIPVEQDESPDYETRIEFDESPIIEDDMHDFESTPSPKLPSEQVHEMVSDEIMPEDDLVDTEVEGTVITEVSEEVDESPSIDYVARRDDEALDDIDTEGPPRDFSTDFVLVEPTPLIVDAHEEEDTQDKSHDAEILEDEETDVESDFDDASHEESSFTWAEYEAAVTPSSEVEELDDDVLSSIDEEVDEELYDDAEITEPPEPPKIWSPYGESSVSDEEDLSDEIDSDDVETGISDATEHYEEESDEAIHPPPPPPPESEEDEEERRRRARRLFFGA